MWPKWWVIGLPWVFVEIGLTVKKGKTKNCTEASGWSLWCHDSTDIIFAQRFVINLLSVREISLYTSQLSLKKILSQEKKPEQNCFCGGTRSTTSSKIYLHLLVLYFSGKPLEYSRQNLFYLAHHGNLNLWG